MVMGMLAHQMRAEYPSGLIALSLLNFRSRIRVFMCGCWQDIETVLPESGPCWLPGCRGRKFRFNTKD